MWINDFFLLILKGKILTFQWTIRIHLMTNNLNLHPNNPPIYSIIHTVVHFLHRSRQFEFLHFCSFCLPLLIIKNLSLNHVIILWEWFLGDSCNKLVFYFRWDVVYSRNLMSGGWRMLCVCVSVNIDMFWKC